MDGICYIFFILTIFIKWAYKYVMELILQTPDFIKIVYRNSYNEDVGHKIKVTKYHWIINSLKLLGQITNVDHVQKSFNGVKAIF